MEYYYGVFIKNGKQIEVEFPDLPGCVTFGDTWEEAYDNAIDVLAGWLTNAEKQFVNTPSSHEMLEKDKTGELVPIPIDKKIMESYETSKRFNVIFPLGTLERVDEFRKTQGLKRSTLLLKAVEEYFESHHI